MKKTTLVKGLALSALLSFGAAKAAKLEESAVTSFEDYLHKSKAGKEYTQTMEARQNNVQNELKQMAMEGQRIEEEQKKLRNDLAKTKVVSSGIAQGDTERKIRDLEYKKNELEAKIQRVYQEGYADLQRLQMQMLQPLRAEFVEIVREWAKEKDLTYVFDENGAILYRKDEKDATQDIIKLSDKKSEHKATLAKNKVDTTKSPSKVA